MKISIVLLVVSIFFFFNDTATTEIYTLSLHDALPIRAARSWPAAGRAVAHPPARHRRSEEHTSELQSRVDLVCRLLLEKKKQLGNQKVEIKQAQDIEKCDTIEICQ